jgi:hypothetical protein
VGCYAGRGGEVVAERTSATRLAHAAEAPDVTGCRGISCSEHFLVQLAVVRVPPAPSGMGATARYHRASPQGAELRARRITFSWLRRCAGNRTPAGAEERGGTDLAARAVQRTQLDPSPSHHLLLVVETDPVRAKRPRFGFGFGNWQTSCYSYSLAMVENFRLGF